MSSPVNFFSESFSFPSQPMGSPTSYHITPSPSYTDLSYLFPSPPVIPAPIVPRFDAPFNFENPSFNFENPEIQNIERVFNRVKNWINLRPQGLRARFYASLFNKTRTGLYDHSIAELNKIDEANKEITQFIQGGGIRCTLIKNQDINFISQKIREVLEIKQKQNRDWKQMSFTTILTGAALVGGAVLHAQPLLIAACACGVFTLFRSLYLHGKSASIQLDFQCRFNEIQQRINTPLINPLA